MILDNIPRLTLQKLAELIKHRGGNYDALAKLLHLPLTYELLGAELVRGVPPILQSLEYIDFID